MLKLDDMSTLANLNHNFTQVGQKLTKITKYKKSISTLPEIILKHRKIIKFLVLLKYFYLFCFEQRLP